MPSSQLLRDRVALVTGASRNIGAGIAARLADHGAKVAVNYVNNENLAEQVVSEINGAGGDARAFQADVTDPAAVDRMVKEIVSTWGSLDILVNNARPIPTVRDPYLSLTPDQVQVRVTAELQAADVCCRAVFPYMKHRGWGRIVNISSTAARSAGPDTVGYRVAKASLEALSRVVAAEFAPYGITVNVVAPGWVITDRIATMLTPERREQLAAESPMGRLATTDDIGGAVAVLCFEDARFITGQYLYANGGAIMP